MGRAHTLPFSALLLQISACGLDWQRNVDAEAGAQADSSVDAGDGSSASDTSNEGGVGPSTFNAPEGGALAMSSEAGAQPCAAAGPCVHGSCVSGKCVCPATWSGATCAEDVDECSASLHGCEEPFTCLNTPGGYTCQGQQADFPIPPDTRSPDDFVIMHRDTTLFDKHTGLMWELTLSDVHLVNYGSGVETCALNIKFGNGDWVWRMPTAIELATLFGQAPFPTQPALLTASTPERYWARSQGSTPWTLDMRDGLFETHSTGLTTFYNNRCVRVHEVKFEGTPAERYVQDEAADTVRDKRTKLTFQRKSGAQVSSFAAAQSVCAALQQGGRSWRLPTTLELLSTLDQALANPAMARAYQGPFGRTWSSTNARKSASSHMCVDTQTMGTAITADGSSCLVRCVSPDP